MRFGIVGNGVVGSATAKIWQTVGEVRTWDIDPYKASHNFAKVAECDYVFICVPTPGTDSGPLDCSLVMEVATKLSVLEPMCAVIRSTVNVGTTRKFAEKSGWPTVFWPEFLSMRTAEQDALNPICNLIGSTDLNREPEVNFYFTVKDRFSSPTVKHAEVVEAAKLFSNAYGAAHVSLMNELSEIAEHNGLKWESVYECLKATGRVNETYSQVPGHNGYGWRSHCWQKDLPATLAMGDLWLQSVSMLDAAIKRNAIDTRRKMEELCPSPT